MNDDFEGAEVSFRVAVGIDSTDEMIAGRFGEFLMAKGRRLKDSGADNLTLASVFTEAATNLEKRDGPGNTVVQSLKLQAEELQIS